MEITGTSNAISVTVLCFQRQAEELPASEAPKPTVSSKKNLDDDPS